MASDSVLLKQCNRKEKCVNPLGSWLPATSEYFCVKRSNKGGLNGRCNACNHAISAQWKLEHPDYMPEYLKQYRADNVEALKEGRKDYYLRNRDFYLASFRAYHLVHRDFVNNRRRIYHAEHPECARTARRNRRARIKSVGGFFTPADLELQYRSQHGKCWHCGKVVGDNWHADHLIPLSRGGSNDARNIVISCPTCNLSKHDKLPQEWNGRLL